METDFNIISFLFKILLISAIALLVFLLTNRSHDAKVFSDHGSTTFTPEMVSNTPPVPY
ncbi:MAG: hypothetical protein KJP01_07575 [Gramella sp.]|nr:hypothetical protein [Christiangramia sp.]